MNLSRPVETLIPGAQGRLLGALARVDAELTVSALAAVAGVGRTRASAVLSALADLGVVSRREVGPTVLVRLERGNAAGQVVARLAGLRSKGIEELRELAGGLDPQPVSLSLFGSLARGNADATSDIDLLAIRPEDGGGESWAASLTEFSSHARILTGNRIQILDYDLSDLRRRYAARDDAPGARFWHSVAEDALTLAGADFRELVGLAMPRGSSRHPVSRADATAYLAKSRSWLAASQESLAAERWDVAAGSAVTAGINACDAICGALLGQRSGGGHDEAVGLLATAGDDGRHAARQLAQLLRFKAPAQYDPAPMAATDARKAVELAARLAERATAIIAQTSR